MTKIKKIFENFKDETLLNEIVGSTEDTEIFDDWDKLKDNDDKRLPIWLEKVTPTSLLFTYKGNALRVNCNSDVMSVLSFIPKPVTNFFWVSGCDKVAKVLTINYLECPEIRVIDELEIGFTEITMQANRSSNDLNKTLCKKYSFQINKENIIFYATYSNKDNITIYGLGARAEIDVTDNKWVIKKERKFSFPAK